MFQHHDELVVGTLLVHAGVLDIVGEDLVVALAKQVRFEGGFFCERQLASEEVLEGLF